MDAIKAKPPTRRFTRRGFMRAGIRTGIGGCVCALGGVTWGKAEPHWLDVEHREFTLPRLPTAFDGFRIAHLSDFHVDVGGVTMRDRLHLLVQRVNALQPDAVMLTGDYVTDPGRQWTDEFAAGFHGLKAPIRIAVLGNHDHWSNPWLVREALQACDIRELLNEVMTIRRGADALHLCGMDDPFGKANLGALVQAVPHGECAIIMQHQPDLADRISKTGVFDLQLSGHSHGGQVRLPGIGALRLPPGGVKYDMGHYHVGKMQLYTTRGIGTLRPAVRFNCRPELTHITLRAA